MQRFTYPKSVKREPLGLDQANEVLRQLSAYLVREHRKGKIPLIVAGAGVSSANLEQRGDSKTLFQKGLPCLTGMILKLYEQVEAEPPGSPELEKLRGMFYEAQGNPGGDRFVERIDREWISKLFGTLSDSTDKDLQKLWDDFCKWFFFRCCEAADGSQGGALNISTPRAAEEIAKMYSSLDAVCLSANFDDFLEYALAGAGGSRLGISLFNREDINGYFRRKRREGRPFSDPPFNRCVLHANGDVIWLHCSGDHDEGYCPRRERYVPAFHDRRHMLPEKTEKTPQDEILRCRICGSTMKPTMTMPGTYEKDNNTRQIISSIWEHLATKISCVITVGLSCNWDDILLKFILGLLLEREIPHLDINDLSDPTHQGNTEIIQQIVREKRFQSRGIRADAAEGLKLLNGAIKQAASELPPAAPAPCKGTMPDFYDELVDILKKYPEIQHLQRVSQLGLKALSARRGEENDRWEHSKEVAEIAYQLYSKLCANSRKEESLFEQVLLCAAGLLHDCGHLPFSHLLEDVFEELSWGISERGDAFKHNQYSKVLIHRMCERENSPLKAFFDRHGVSPEEVVQLIEGNYGIGYLDTLINSAVDADKIAYIFTDAEQMQRALMLRKDEFIDRLMEKAYITQEGFVALDGTSARQAMRLLDERRRMYDELYLDPRMRCMEAAAKYIITTYFVQKYNRVSFDERFSVSENEADLGGYRIMLAVDDMIRMEDGEESCMEDLSPSVGERTRQSLAICMGIVQRLAASGEETSLEEWQLLKRMYRQLTGEHWQKPD